MIFLNTILAVTAASAIVGTVATKNIEITQYEKEISFNAKDFNKEKVLIEIEKLRNEIDRVNIYEEALKSGKKDFNKQSQAPVVDDLAEEIMEQKESIKALSDLISVSTHDILNKHVVFEDLVKTSKTMAENIKLKKLEIEVLISQESSVGVSEDFSEIIKAKKTERQNIVAQKKLISRKISKTGKKIDKKTIEIMILQNEFHRCSAVLNNLNETVKKTPINKTGVLWVLHDLLAETMVDLNLSHKNLSSAIQAKIKLESEMEQFLVANISKHIEYTKKAQELKKDIKNYEKQKQTNVIVSNSGNIDQLNKSLAENENAYSQMLADIDSQKADIAIQEDQNDQLHVALADLEKTVKQLEQIVKEESGKLSPSDEYKNMLNEDLDTLNNIRNNLIYKKHKLDRQLIYYANI